MNVLKSCLAAVIAFSMTAGAFAADGKGKIEGKVLGKDGAGAVGVNIRVTEAKGKGDKKKDKAAPAAADDKGKDKEKGKNAPVAKTKSEKDGVFSMSDIPAGDYIVAAMTKDGLMAREKVTVKADETAKVELKLAEKKEGGKKGKNKAAK